MTKRSSCLPGATGLAVRSTMPPFAKPCRPWRALIGPCPNRPHRHASRKSPLGKCDRQAFAACWSIARITNALTLQKSAAINGLMTSGYLILNLGSFAKRAEKEARSFGEMMTLGKRSHDLLGVRGLRLGLREAP